jgi:hypothetical protein
MKRFFSIGLEIGGWDSANQIPKERRQQRFSINLDLDLDTNLSSSKF